MTWKVSNVVSQRIEFVVRAISKKESVSELCEEYGVRDEEKEYLDGNRQRPGD